VELAALAALVMLAFLVATAALVVTRPRQRGPARQIFLETVLPRQRAPVVLAALEAQAARAQQTVRAAQAGMPHRVQP
jgi:hypothetical protein